MLRFFRAFLATLLGLVDECYRAVMLHYGRDLAAEAAQAREAEAARAERQAEAARMEERHAEQLDATLALLEALQAGLVPESALPEIRQIVDPEAAAGRREARRARAEASREAIRALVPARPARQAREEMVVRSGWPTIIDPEEGAAASVGYYPA